MRPVFLLGSETIKNKGKARNATILDPARFPPLRTCRYYPFKPFSPIVAPNVVLWNLRILILST